MSTRPAACSSRPPLAAACLLALVVSLPAAALGSGGGAVSGREVAQLSAGTDSTWRPNFRIGPVEFNRPLPDDVSVLRRGDDGSFVVRTLGSRAIIRGVVFADPNSGTSGARAIWTQSRRLSFRGVRVGMHRRTARRKLGSRFRAVRSGRCGWLGSSALREDATGPVSTQLFFRRRTGRVYQIALNEITEIDCPR